MFRWGIAGTGKIAHSMADTIAAMDDAEVVSVSSSTLERAVAFGAHHGITNAVAPHSALAESEVDAVYVATTNDSHHPISLDLLEQGIPVLCEKPLAMDASQAVEMIETARQRSTLLMEAMWMVFQPSHRRLLELIGEGRIGDVRYVTADFGYPAQLDRIFRKDQGGGSLLDLGVYTLTFASEVAGAITQVTADAQLRDGVDMSVGQIARHESGAMSITGTTVLADTNQAATVAGAEGRIVVHAPFHHSPMLSLWKGGEMIETWDLSYEGSGYRFEVEHFQDCLTKGLSESPIRPFDDTLAIMRVMDDVRRQIGMSWD